MASNVVTLARRHAWGIALAVLLATAMVFPRWYLLATEPDEGVRIQATPWGAGGQGEDETAYAAGIRAAYDGDLIIRDFHVNVDEGPPLSTRTPERVVGVLGHVTGGMFLSWAIVSTIAAMAMFLLMYALGVQLTGSRALAALLVPTLFLVMHVHSMALGFLPLRHSDVLERILTIDPEREFHHWARFVAPAIPAPVALGAFLALPPAVATGRRAWMLASAVLMASLIYIYIFPAASMALACAAWLGWFAWRREWAPFKRLAAVGAGAIVLALPEVVVLAWNVIESTEDYRARTGFAPYTIYISWIAVIQRAAVGVPCAYVAWRYGDRDRAFFFSAALLSPLVLAKLSDFFPQSDHFLFSVWPYFALPLVIMALGEAHRLFDEGTRRLVYGALAGVAVVGIAYPFVYQARALRQTEDEFAISRGERNAYRWLEDNAAEDTTVVSPSRSTHFLLASLTQAYGYLPDGVYSRLSDDEIADRYLRMQAALGYSEETTFERIEPGRGPAPDEAVREGDTLEMHWERSMAEQLFGDPQTVHPDRIASRIPEWRERFRDYQQLSNVLSAYDADYLLCDHRARFWPVVDAAPGTYVTVAFEQDDVTLYELVTADAEGAEEFAGCDAT